MTEAEWLACENPTAMVEYLRGRSSDRRWRLLNCLCGRLAWVDITDERSRQAVDIGEKYADNLASESQREQVLVAAGQVVEEAVGFQEFRYAAHAAIARDCVMPRIKGSLRFLPSEETHGQICTYIRELFRNPFRSACIDLSWLSWRDGTVEKIAQAIYNEPAFDRLPILADALEDAGCTDPQILDHCRQPGEHVRGCWVIDALLGKS